MAGKKRSRDAVVSFEASPIHADEAKDVCPPVLYKYMGVKYGIEVFIKERIKYTQPSELNDPFECKPLIIGTISPAEVERLKSYRREYDLLRERGVKEGWLGTEDPHREQAVKLLKELENYTLEMENTIKETFETYEQLSETFTIPTVRVFLGMLCLTKSRDNLLMWSHYADQHAGFVIGVDTTHPCVNRRANWLGSDNFNYFKPVIYSEDRPNIYAPDVLGPESILTKSKEWSYEEEWRVVSAISDLTRDSKSGKYFHELPIEAVKEVYMGSRMLPEIRQNIVDELVKQKERHSIRLFQMEEHPEKYRLVETEVEYRKAEVVG